jgi:hypothetical protein
LASTSSGFITYHHGTNDRKAAYGWVSVNWIVWSLTTLIPSSFRKSESIQAGPWLSLSVRANDQRTASAVTGSPLVNFACLARWNVHVLASGETSQRSASQGWISGGLPTYFTSAS